MNFFCLPLEIIFNLAVKCLRKASSSRSEENIMILQQKLAKAINSKKWKKAKELIAKGADINYCTNKYGEPLLFAAKDVPTIRKILDLGADINARDVSGEGILGHAILNLWSLDAVQELILRGAFVGARNNLYISPLERAVVVGNHEKIKLLIENGACCRDDGRISETPMNYCINNFEGAKTVIKFVMLKYFEEDYSDMIGLENYNYPYIFKNYEYLKQYFVKCEIELKRMKTIKIGQKCSLLDLLRCNDNYPTINSYNTELQLLLSCIADNAKQSNRNRIFPIYQDAIKEAVGNALQRQELLEQLEQLNLSVTKNEEEKSVSLDISSKLTIFKYLPNEALQALVKSYKKQKSFKGHLRSIFKFKKSSLSF